MMPVQIIKQFFNDMRRQKLRSTLTMFGIFWGTCSIVLLFAFGIGITEAQLRSQKGDGREYCHCLAGHNVQGVQGPAARAARSPHR